MRVIRKKNYKLMQGGSRLVIHTERKPCAWGKVLPVDEFTSTDRDCGAFSPSKDATVDLLSIINELHTGCLSHRGNLTLQSIATVVTGEIDYLTVGSN